MTMMSKEQKEREAAFARLEKEYEKELVRNYQLALKELRSKIALAYERYDGSWTEMNRYNRLVKLEKEIAKEIQQLTGKNAQTLVNGLSETYEEIYYRTAYSLTNTVAADLQFVMLEKEVIHKSLENPLDKIGFLQRNQENQMILTRQLREQLTQSFILGESYRAAAKRIKDRMNIGAKNALRISRTEMHRVRNQALLDSMQEGADRGITLKKHWLATIDGRTRHSHGRLDGIQVDLDKQFEIDGKKAEGPGLFGLPEEDINCRCTMLEVVDGFEPRYRRVKDVGIVRYATYEEFLKTGLKELKVAN